MRALTDKPRGDGVDRTGPITELPEFASDEEEREWWAALHREVACDLLPAETFEFDVEPDADVSQAD